VAKDQRFQYGRPQDHRNQEIMAKLDQSQCREWKPHIWMETQIADKMFDGRKSDGSGMHLILSKSNIGWQDAESSPEGNTHAALENGAIFETKFFLSGSEVAFVKRDSTSQRL
jgi:hypothetical protein